MRVNNMLLMARREWTILRRSRAARATLFLLFLLAWLPPVLLSLRTGKLGLATFSEVIPLGVATGGVFLPLLALLAGADLIAAEHEDGYLIPVLTLPISRDACYMGKYLGRTAIGGVAYILAFVSAGLTIGIIRGSAGWEGYLILAGAGLLLTVSCMGVGSALAAGGRGRVAAYAGALAMWVLLVFVIDAALLTAVVALAPPAPEQVGRHGHSELGGVAGSAHEPDSPAFDSRSQAAPWWLALDPVDLFRAGVLTLSPRPSITSPSASGSEVERPWLFLIVSWLIWIIAPVAIGLYRFRRARIF